MSKGILDTILTGGVSDIVKGVVGIFDSLHTSEEEKQDAERQVFDMVTSRMAVIEQSIQARFRMVTEIIQSEMASGNIYTKSARPTIVYAGLLIHMLNAFGQMLGAQPIEVDPNFTYVWGGVCGVWIVGRSAEKAGKRSRATELVTGNPGTSPQL